MTQVDGAGHAALANLRLKFENLLLDKEKEEQKERDDEARKR